MNMYRNIYTYIETKQPSLTQQPNKYTYQYPYTSISIIHTHRLHTLMLMDKS